MDSIRRLAEAIAYPELVPADAQSFVFLVDDCEIKASEMSGRLILTYVLWHAPETPDEISERLPVVLAGYAAGRVLREEATLAWDDSVQAMLLWQDVPVSFPPEKLCRFMEVFVVSMEWWRERIADLTTPAPVFPEMMIRP